MAPSIPWWNKVPFIRLLLPFMAGIIFQWEFRFAFLLLIAAWTGILLVILFFFMLPVKTKFHFKTLNGIFMCLQVLITGSIITYRHDIRNDPRRIETMQGNYQYLCVLLAESPVEKPGSFKATASLTGITDEGLKIPLKDHVIIYFKKDSVAKRLHYGSELLFKKTPQLIRNSGNPGSFDFARFCLFQSITHQVYLASDDFILLPDRKIRDVNSFVLGCRQMILGSLKQNIHGKKELGLAEALLIGYKDDLDKNLVQSYTKTGVVHIIAISGMHLALIYGLLVWLTWPLKKTAWLRAIIMLSGLWLFTLMAGAQASVVRSCVMFTCLATGKVIDRKSSIYNTLALSAFILLSFQPFWLWDVGFQLSYAAVLSIILFYRNVYGWIFLPNKLLDAIWKLMAVSIAAQILTTPLSLFHFHQFPVFFLLTNIIAVPLSGIILFGEIFLCALTWLTPVASLFGRLTELMIRWMNLYVERIEQMPFALWTGFSISFLQVLLLLVMTSAFYAWIMQKKKSFFLIMLPAVLFFMCIRTTSFIKAQTQKKIIIYNIPKSHAVDLVSGRSVYFLCSTSLLLNSNLMDFHIIPSRTLHRIRHQQLQTAWHDVAFAGRRFLFLDTTFHFYPAAIKTKADMAVLSGDVKNTIEQIRSFFDLHLVIMDASVPFWKSVRWKKECDSLHIPYYDVAEKGAFVMNL